MKAEMVAHKPYELKVENRSRYLYAHIKSDSPRPTDAREYLKDIAEKCTEAQCTRLIIDNGLLQSFLVWDIFSVVPFFAGIGNESVKVAVIDKYAPITKKELSIVVGRKGGLDIQVFTDIDEAENWLLDN